MTVVDPLLEAAAVVVKNVRKKVPDQLRKSNAIFNLITEKQVVKISGGVEITTPFKAYVNNAINYINGTTDTIDMNVYQQLVYAKFPWVYRVLPVNFTLDEYTKAYEAEEAMADFFAIKINGAIADGVRNFTTGFYNSRSSMDPKSFNGMRDILATSGTSYGGWADTDFTGDVWAPIIDTTNQAISYSAISSKIGQLKGRIQADSQPNRFGDDLKVDFAICNSFLWSNFKINEQAKQRFTNVRVTDANDVSIGWDMYDVDGVKVQIDEFAPGSASSSAFDNWFIILASGALELRAKYGGFKGLQKSPFDSEDIRIPNQTIMGSQEFFAGALVAPSRRAFAVLKNLK